MALLKAKTAYGTVVGQPTGYQASTIFKGIPFAKPPVGDLRWRTPQAPDAWEGTRECFTYGPIAPQRRPPEGTFYRKEFYPIEWPTSEDCLYLNVITPAESADERLPVALWIYGGAFVQGYAHKIETDGEAFAQRGCVYVSINYRVGAFGYVSCPELDAETGELSGNYGLMDQIAALNWVYENIAAFGGDPARITVMGQSAGAASVYDLLCSPQTRGKIAGAVMESGGGPICEMLDNEHTRELSAEFLRRCGGLEAARALGTEELFDIWLGLLGEQTPRILPIQPLNGHKTLPGDVVGTFRAGRFANVPCLVGSMAEEDNSYGTPGVTFMRDVFLGGSVALCEKQAEAGRTPAYLYHITNQVPGEPATGAFHSSEHNYIFQTLSRSWRPYTGADYELSNTMCALWTNFVKTGNPNGKDLPTWKPYTACDKRAMRFNRTQPCQMIEVPLYDGHAHELAEEALGRPLN